MHKIVIIPIVFVFLIFLNSPMLLYPLIPGINPCNNVKEFSLIGKTLFVSDLHVLDLENPDPKYLEIGRFSDKEQIENVVVVGDFFEKKNEFNNYEGNQYRAMVDVLGLYNAKLFWILGSWVHDPNDLEPDDYGDITVTGKCGKFIIDGTRVVAYHGRHVSFGWLGFGLSYLTKKLLLERTWKKLAGVEKDTIVIIGHLHVGGLDKNSLVANPGGWKKLPIFKPPLGTGVVLNKNELKIVKILDREVREKNSEVVGERSEKI